MTGLPTTKNLALNERDYGDLSGLNKDDARKKWGEDQVLVWRRSYDAAARRRKPEGYAGARAALLRAGDLARRAARTAHAGRRPRQIAARADHGAGEADARADFEARILATGVPVIYRLNADLTVATKVDLAA